MPKKIIKIKPKEGLKVPKPLSNIFLKEDGEDVPRSAYWIRRLKSGDVEEIKAESNPPKDPPKLDPKDPPQEDSKEESEAPGPKTTKKKTTKKKTNQEDS